jgi:hypothetical protein
MKTSVIASAMLLLIGAGCVSSQPAPQPPVTEQPAPQPQPEPLVSEDPVYGPSYKANMIVVDTLRIGDKVASPLVLTGKARGNWYFEASFPVELIDSNNKLVANGIAQAQGDWMTTNFVPFKTTLTFLTPDMYDMNATLVFKKDNPSGEPQNDDQMRFPVRFDINEVNAE